MLKIDNDLMWLAHNRQEADTTTVLESIRCKYTTSNTPLSSLLSYFLQLNFWLFGVTICRCWG